MKTLIVEDDFVSRVVLYDILSPISRCDIATTGNEAVWAFDYAWEKNDPYDLICLDIMLPNLSGHQVLEEIRNKEREKGIYCLYGVKIIMTSSLHESQHIIKAFKGQCEGYLIKPVVKKKLIDNLINLELLNSPIKDGGTENNINDEAVFNFQ